MAPRSRGLSRCRTKSFLYKLQLGPKPDFKFELLPLHSPLLRQSLLVSFPPLIDMLKFSGYSYLIRGQHLGKSITRPSSIRVVPDTCLVKSSSYPVPSGAPSLSLRPVDRQSYN